MTLLTVTYPDPERIVKDYLDPLISDATVAVGVPSDWTPRSGSHIQVALDGTFMANHPVSVDATIRLVARAAGPTEAKRLAQHAAGLLLAHPGTAADSPGSIARTSPLVGLIPARDEQTGAEIASVTVRVTLRSIPIP